MVFDMPEDTRDVAEKLLKNMAKTQREHKGKCKNPACGFEAPDNALFNCEVCGANICNKCSNMTNDCVMICRACIKAKGLTSADLQFQLDRARVASLIMVH